MKSMLDSLRCASAAVLALGLVGCASLPSSTYTPAVMNALSTQSQTHCLGRYLIDLPKGFELRTGGWGDIELYYGLDKNFERVYASVKTGLYTPSQFLQASRARFDELNSTINAATKSPMLLKAEKLDDYAVLLRRHDDDNYDSSIKSEVHQLIGQRYVVFEGESYVSDELALKTEVPNRYLTIDTGPTEKRLKTIFSRLLPYVNASSAPVGFCQQGVVFDVGQDDEESIFKFYDESRPDVHVEISYHAVKGQSKESLFERDAVKDRRILPLYVQSGGVQVRKRETTLGGMPAQELLYKLSKPIVQHVYRIETRTATQSLRQPSLSMKLITGRTQGKSDEDQTSSSLSDEQVMQLWDGIVRSVRPRSAAVAKRSVHCRPGDVCPKSGQWMVVAAEHAPDGVKWQIQRMDPQMIYAHLGNAMPAIPHRPAQEQHEYEWKLVVW